MKILGYGALQYLLSKLKNKFVSLYGNQEIQGVKTFSDPAAFLNGFSALHGNFSFGDTLNVGMELGRRDGIPGTPYIDFHSDGSPATDFNTRLLCAGNTLQWTASDGMFLNSVRIPVSASVFRIQTLTQAEYDASAKDSNTLYVILG